MTRRWTSLQDSDATPFDAGSTGLTSKTSGEAIRELVNRVTVSASPGFSFGRTGNLSSGTWLLRPGSVPSNKSGINVGIGTPLLLKVTVASENEDTYSVGIYQHDGNEINLNLVTTVSITAVRKQVFDLSAALEFDRQIAVRVLTGSAKNLGVDLQLSGSTS